MTGKLEQPEQSSVVMGANFCTLSQIEQLTSA